MTMKSLIGRELTQSIYDSVLIWHNKCNLCNGYSTQDITHCLVSQTFVRLLVFSNFLQTQKEISSFCRLFEKWDQYLFLGNRARYRFVVLYYHSCSIGKRRLIIELDNYKQSSIANRVRLLRTSKHLIATLAKSGPLDFPSKKSFLLFFAHEKGLGHMFQKQFNCSPILFFCVATSQK